MISIPSALTVPFMVGFGGAHEVSLILALKEWNIPRQSVTLLASGPAANRLLALSSGALDATLLAPPETGEAARMGLPTLAHMTLFGTTKLAASIRGKFPQCLNSAPFVLPTSNTAARRSLDQWFELEKIRPVIVAECEDSALLQVFGQRGLGLFFAPSVVGAEIQRQSHVKAIGRVEGVRERFFAISLDRKLKHPAVVAISEAARARLSD